MSRRTMNPNNNQSSRGSAPSRGVSPGLRGMGFQGKKTSMTSGHNHSNIPQLSVQPETPLPPLMTRNNSMLTSGSHLGKMAEHQGNKQLPKIIPSSQSESTNHVFRQPAPVSSRSSNGVVFSSHMTSRQTNGMHHISQAGHMMQHISKQDKSEYGPDCLDLNRTQQVYGSKISNSNDGNHFDDKMTNQQLQSLAPTPTPSDVSSIANTPRHQVATPTSMSMASDHSISKSDRGYLLNPGHFPLKNESWGAFKVLPGLGQSGANSVVGSEMGDGPPNCGDMSQYGSLNSLSPFPIPDFSPLGSSLTSPRHSAKQLSKGKRALSISPLSSGGIDLDNLIRLSPTSLSGSRGASSSTSPMPGHVYSGSVGHLQARQSRGNALHLHNGSSAVNSYINYAASSQQSMNANFSQQQNGVKKENEPSPEQYESNSHMIPYMHMASLEQDKPNIAMHTNQMVVPQHQNMSFIEQLYGRNDHQMVPQGQHVPYVETSQFKQEPNGELYPAENGHMVAQLPPTSVGSSIQDPSPMEASVPPPPPYPGAQNFQHSPKPSHSPHTTGMDKKDNGEEPENKQLICKWIDCNHMFKEQSDLVSHIEKQHIDQRKGEENFTCFWQGCVRRYKPFNARYKLLIHMRVHSGEKPNKCTFENCNKAFSRLENLKIHLRSHTGERPYECPHPGCSKAFSNSSDRAKHQRTHKDTKPYACTVPGCNKRYTDPSSLRKHHKNHTSKEQQARKRMRMGEKDEYGGGGGMIDGILSVQAMRHMDDRSPHDMYAGMQFGRHAASHGQGPLGLHNSMPSPAMAPSDEFDRRMDVVGGGFNPAPNGALLAPRRVVGNIVSQPGNQQGASLPTLQGTKLAPGMQGMPPPPPYQEQQYQQPTPVATPGPGDVAQPMQTEEGDTSQQTPSSMMPPYSTYLPVTSSYQHRVHHVNYVPQSGNAPLMNDYANMPCNLQEARMTFGQQSNHGFPAMVPTLEDTLRELPYDAIHLQRALSNHSGSV